MDVSESDVKALVERMGRSEPFRLSEIQRRLLVYLAAQSLLPESDQLKEYTIGVEALGKPESYDPRHDATVRVQTAKLRQKIQDYYLTEGQSERVLAEFPKGHFKLVFSYREAAPAARAGRWVGWRKPALILWAALSLGLVAACIYLRTESSRLERESASFGQHSPALDEFWKTFQRRDHTLVCIGVPLFVRLNESGTFRNSFLNDWEAAATSGFVKSLRRAFPGHEPQPWYNFTGIGEANAAFVLAELFSARGLSPRLIDSSQLTWSEVGDNDVVFIGPPKFIPQLKDLPVACDFVQEDEGVRNLHPRPGEPAYFRDQSGTTVDSKGRAYALISRLPGLHAKGQILILGGTWTEGTHAAAQYVTLETHVRELLDRLRLRNGTIPDYFQVVIVANIQRSTPVEVSYVLHHTLTSPPLPNAAGSAK